MTCVGRTPGVVYPVSCDGTVVSDLCFVLKIRLLPTRDHLGHCVVCWASHLLSLTLGLLFSKQEVT